ncbi:MAG: DUF4190 domain-containing protein [Sandaracinaceae bacterium]|nr:DUF4190 domain-containing protein [Sandaracinaceae bacterium]MCC6874079.1 DUF4190 domain-containing protein [Sandaracinaceae bacterium]
MYPPGQPPFGAPPPNQFGPGFAPQPQRPTNTLAIVALVGGIVSWIMLPFAGAIVGVICGHMARKQIRQTGEDGDQLAVVGLVLSYSHLAVTCLTCGVMILFYAGIFAAIGLSGAAQHY